MVTWTSYWQDSNGSTGVYAQMYDANGNLVTSLNAESTEIANWTIVANGDVNASGSFEDIYTIACDVI